MIYRIFKTWILFAFLAAAMCGLVYLSIQQSLRMGANDPQIQTAEYAARSVESGVPITSIVPSTRIDIDKDLLPYIVFFDQSGTAIAGSGWLDNAAPKLPVGIFAYVAAHGEDRLTWQPRPGVRSAIVIVPVANSTSTAFVMVGRSLREIEIREDQALHEALATWLAAVIGIFMIQLFFATAERRKEK